MGSRGPQPTPPIERLLQKIEKDPETGCWLYTGHLAPNGYGHIFNTKVPGEPRTLLVHRVSYEFFVGPIPDGHVIDHLCRVRHCVQPTHLEAVVFKENVNRGAATGQRLWDGVHWTARKKEGAR